MEPLLNGIAGLAALIAFGSGIWLQGRTIETDYAELRSRRLLRSLAIPIRLWIPALIIAIAIIYSLAVTVSGAISGDNIELARDLRIGGAIFLIGALFSIKQIFAPIFVGAVFAFAIHSFLTGGSFQWIPFFDWTVAVSEPYLPSAFEKLYLPITLTVALVNAILGFFDKSDFLASFS